MYTIKIESTRQKLDVCICVYARDGGLESIKLITLSSILISLEVINI